MADFDIPVFLNNNAPSMLLQHSANLRDKLSSQFSNPIRQDFAPSGARYRQALFSMKRDERRYSAKLALAKQAVLAQLRSCRKIIGPCIANRVKPKANLRLSKFSLS
jgi:hypothetical protein